MSARLLIHTNGSAGTTHWIEKPVIRVGSDPSSDVVIPNAAIAPHALTVEFRQTGYRVYNRSSAQVFLGSRILDPGQHTNWLDTDLLELPDGVSLALEADDDPSPAPRPARFSHQQHPQPFDQDQLETQVIDAHAMDAHAMDALAIENSSTTPPRLNRAIPNRSHPTADSSIAGKSTGSNTMLQLAVIGFCLLGSVGLLVRHQLKRSSSSEISAGVQVPTFNQIVQQARQPGSDIPPDLLDQLQLAEAALIRGQRTEAHRRYQHLYDRLVRQATADDRTTDTSSPEPASSSEQPSTSLQQLNLLIRGRMATAK